MRNALLSLIVSGVLLVGCFEKSQAAEFGSPSTYALPVVPSDRATAEATEPGLLPVRYNDQSQLPLLDQSARTSAAPQSSIVEAIPTPTAFHAGSVLLLGIFMTRFLRKLRWV